MTNRISAGKERRESRVSVLVHLGSYNKISYRWLKNNRNSFLIVPEVKKSKVKAPAD